MTRKVKMSPLYKKIYEQYKYCVQDEFLEKNCFKKVVEQQIIDIFEEWKILNKRLDFLLYVMYSIKVSPEYFEKYCLRDKCNLLEYINSVQNIIEKQNELQINFKEIIKK